MQLHGQSLFGTLVQVGGEAQVDSCPHEDGTYINQASEPQFPLFRGAATKTRSADSSWPGISFGASGTVSFDSEGTRRMLNQLFMVNGSIGAASFQNPGESLTGSNPFVPSGVSGREVQEQCRNFPDSTPISTTGADWRASYDSGSVSGQFYNYPASNMMGTSLGCHMPISQIAPEAYTESQNLTRRFSLAVPSSHFMNVNNVDYQVPNELQLDTGSPNLLFVMEDPSGKESTKENGEFVSARRHSVGTPHLYCCPWTGCNKVFNRFYNLRSHYRIHSGEKPFSCNYCDASFARNHDLKRHERIHLKTKPFVCPICSKAFSRNDAMNRHVRLNSCTRTA